MTSFSPMFSHTHTQVHLWSRVCLFVWFFLTNQKGNYTLLSVWYCSSCNRLYLFKTCNISVWNSQKGPTVADNNLSKIFDKNMIPPPIEWISNTDCIIDNNCCCIKEVLTIIKQNSLPKHTTICQQYWVKKIYGHVLPYRPQ